MDLRKFRCHLTETAKWVIYKENRTTEGGHKDLSKYWLCIRECLDVFCQFLGCPANVGGAGRATDSQSGPFPTNVIFRALSLLLCCYS